MKKLLVMVALLSTMVMPVSAADFNGDGTGDIAIFRPSSGLWSVREITRTYFGETGDSPVPGDYNGSGTDNVAIFRSSSGLWAVSGVTRAYFGGASDEAKPGDYNGDRVSDIGIFRAGSGLWAVRGITRIYYGRSGDSAISAGTVKAPTRIIDDSTTTQVAGYYNAFDLMVEAPDLATSNIKSGATIFGIMGDSNVVDTSSGDASAADILVGQTAYVDGSEVTGTIATQTLNPASEIVNVGFYEQTTLSDVDSSLATGNIKSGVTIFGISGTYPLIGLTKTGQVTSYEKYDDAYYADPTGTDIGNPRGLGTWSAYTSDGGRFSMYTIVGDVVVKDNATDLMWASCYDQAGCNFGNQTTWAEAITWAEELTFAGKNDWRIPNRRELDSIVDLSKSYPPIDIAFFSVSPGFPFYWTSTTTHTSTAYAWGVFFTGGSVSSGLKTDVYYVRVVRGDM